MQISALSSPYVLLNHHPSFYGPLSRAPGAQEKRRRPLREKVAVAAPASKSAAEQVDKEDDADDDDDEEEVEKPKAKKGRPKKTSSPSKIEVQGDVVVIKGMLYRCSAMLLTHHWWISGKAKARAEEPAPEPEPAPESEHSEDPTLTAILQELLPLLTVKYCSSLIHLNSCLAGHVQRCRKDHQEARQAGLVRQSRGPL